MEKMKNQIFDPRNFGAYGDGCSDDTAAVQEAIDAAAVSGGIVVLTQGVFLCYLLRLQSNVYLDIDATAELLGGTNPIKYQEIGENSYWKPDRASRKNKRALLYAENAENIGIIGKGRIRCQPEAFHHVVDKTMELHDTWIRKSDTEIPGRTILFVGCKGIILQDFLLQDSVGWAVWLLDCEDAAVRGVRILSDTRIPNSDGLHISACRNVHVSNCTIRCADDSIVLRSHQEQLYCPKACENVTVTSCILMSGAAAIRLGHINDYMIRNCVFSNLIVERAACGLVSIMIGMLQKGKKSLDPYRYEGMPESEIPDVLPLTIENIHFQNITANIETGLFTINIQGDMHRIKKISNIVMSDITASCGTYPVIRNPHEYPVDNIILRNATIDIIKEMHNTTSVTWAEFETSFVFNNINDLILDNVRFRKCHFPFDTEIKLRKKNMIR